MIRGGEARGDVPLLDQNGLEGGGRLLRVEASECPAAYVDDDRARRAALTVLVRQQQDRLGDVADLPLDQARLIVRDEGDDVPAGNVAVVDDGEARGVEVETDAGEVAAGDGGSGWSGRGACPER